MLAAPNNGGEHSMNRMRRYPESGALGRRAYQWPIDDLVIQLRKTVRKRCGNQQRPHNRNPDYHSG